MSISFVQYHFAFALMLFPRQNAIKHLVTTINTNFNYIFLDSAEEYNKKCSKLWHYV